MSNRSEKEQRRQERLAAEQAAQQSADRRKRFGLVGGVVLAVAVIAIVAVALAGGGGDDDGTSGGSASGKAPSFGVTNLAEAARAAGCDVTLEQLPEEGRGHTTKSVKYKTNPPTSGEHDPQWSDDGIYTPDNPPDLEQAVHTLEHGRIDFQYKPGTPAERVAQLESLYSEKVKGTSGYHSLLFENFTGMKAAVAATTWRRSITCPTFNDKVFDALRAFRKAYVDKGPEFIP